MSEQYLYATGSGSDQVLHNSFIANSGQDFVRVQFTVWFGGVAKDVALGLANITKNPAWPGDDWGYSNTVGRYTTLTAAGDRLFDWTLPLDIDANDVLVVFFTTTDPGNVSSRMRVRDISVELSNGPESLINL